MTPQRSGFLSFMLTWIFVFFIPSVHSRKCVQKICLKDIVFVALAGENLTINYQLTKPANRSRDSLTCYNQSNGQIYKHDIPATANSPTTINRTFVLNSLKKPDNSGEYYCQYGPAKVYWFLRVRDGGYKANTMYDYTELTTLSIFTAVLLVFSVTGSVYVFRGHWKEKITECVDSGRKQKQNQEERKEGEEGENHVDVPTASSTSFYASLEPRPRSIYDVLDRSAANSEPDKGKAAPKTKETPKTMAKTTQKQDEGVFESVYENF
ncbi:uncharacterized protein si:ch211-243a20.4 isoform X2 [Thunnus albacares]|uniref:uncharacterized protein si:ch211-243a20.4 isoform X2 n=1 Tax=Thunnus albacares TaxID=8236 RepID=UPI001CF70884|nr:uncharacterized protein si:ch211-243a20.4 isoform X2 [Thunnus albacares]